MSARQFRLALSAPLAAGALAIAASSLTAQGGGAGGFVARGGPGAAASHPTILPQTVRALIAAHHPDIASGTSEDNILTLMMDSNGNYVGSAATKANVVARVAPNGDTIIVAAAGGARGAGGGASAVMTAAPAGAIARGSSASATPGGEGGKMTF